MNVNVLEKKDWGDVGMANRDHSFSTCVFSEKLTSIIPW